MWWRSVARSVRVGVRVEDDEVGVAADLDRALAREAEPGRRGRREQVDHALDRQAPAGHALAVDEREQRLDAGRAVADLVERDARRGLGLLDADAVGDVVGGDQVERPVGEPGPQRVAVGGGPQRRGDDVAGAARRVGLLVLGVGQREVVRTGLGRDADAGRLRAADLVERGRGREMDDVDGRVGRPGEGERPGRRDRLDVGWSRGSVVAR